MAEMVVFLDLKYPFLDQPPRLIDFGKEMDASELRSLQMSESMQQLVNDLSYFLVKLQCQHKGYSQRLSHVALLLADEVLQLEIQGS
ncbi:hypothetical protein NC652_015323 [Populus alba x Populus x berolinensis]|nr:hypothetical protein NC652_015323 [Populus alba x Populus x berolinensis]